jgi:bacterioferritin
MLQANLVAERIAVEVYRQLIAMIGNRDPGTTHLLHDILAQEEEHARDLADWIVHA